jgi:diguanylate cyclase (GGDEF)-like protein
LHALLVAGLRSEVPEAESAGFRQAAEQLAMRFGLLQGAAMEALIEAGDPAAGADPLTGIADAGDLHAAMERLIDLYRRYGDPFALLVLDVDGLDRINVAKGRPAGDAALAEVAKSIAHQIRSVDLAFRLEGDEFCILAEHQTASTAQILATRLGKGVEEIVLPGGLPVSASIGVVSCPGHAEEADVLLEFADTALYRAKAAGERVVVAVSRNGNSDP